MYQAVLSSTAATIKIDGRTKTEFNRQASVCPMALDVHY
jgi:hypothetical protein